jgi:hypothetical protein
MSCPGMTPATREEVEFLFPRDAGCLYWREDYEFYLLTDALLSFMKEGKCTELGQEAYAWLEANCPERDRAPFALVMMYARKKETP